jgi:hypothetical protein
MKNPKCKACNYEAEYKEKFYDSAHTCQLPEKCECLIRGYEKCDGACGWSKEIQECICSNYDRKGKSACGFNCPVHPQQEDWENSYPLNTFHGTTKEELIAFIAEEKDKSYKEGYADAIIDIDKLSKEMENAN